MLLNENGRIRSVRLNICMSLIVPVILKKMKLRDGSTNVIRKIKPMNNFDGEIG
jgi:hypothetical protein